MLVSNNFSSFYNEGIAVCTTPATRRMVHISCEEDMHDENQDHLIFPAFDDNFFLSFPKVLYRIRYVKKQSKFYVPFCNSLSIAFTNEKKKLFIPSLFNIRDDLSVCISLPQKGFSKIEDLCKACIQTFWQSDFDDSMYDAYSDYGANSILKDPRRWQKKTKKDPDWVPNGRILKKCTQSFQNFCNLDLHN